MADVREAVARAIEEHEEQHRPERLTEYGEGYKAGMSKAADVVRSTSALEPPAPASQEGDGQPVWRHAASVTHGSDTGLPSRLDADHPAVPGGVLANGVTTCAACDGPVTGDACCTANVVNQEWHTHSCSGRMAGSGPRLIRDESRVVGHDYRAGEVEGWCVLCGRRRELHEPAASQGGGGLAGPRNWSHSLNDGAMVVDPAAPPPAETGGGGAEGEFLAASVAVWREIDRLAAEPGGYRGLDESTALRRTERAAWERYRDSATTPGPGGGLDREAANEQREALIQAIRGIPWRGRPEMAFAVNNAAPVIAVTVLRHLRSAARPQSDPDALRHAVVGAIRQSHGDVAEDVCCTVPERYADAVLAALAPLLAGGGA